METEELKKLFKKYHDGTCTEDEKALLEAWYLGFNEYDLDISHKRIKAIENRIFKELPGNHNVFLRIGIILAAAVVVMGIIATIKLNFFRQEKSLVALSQKQEIAPGSNTAVLTLSNGKKINLKSALNGQLATQPGIQIIKAAGGQIIYKIAGNIDDGDNSKTNNISTPNGGQWQVMLPDGTKVWLNSASTFTYPVSFGNKKLRAVQLTGEAYFEVAKDKVHPFIVKTTQLQVEVLGTHFNINSYPDEPYVKTTLAEGHVKISSIGGKTKILIPGQQASFKNGDLTVDAANVEEALAWKNGYFRFNDENIQSIMRRLSRWYNIDVQYEGAISAEGLNGRISRFKNISQVLKALEATKTVHFKVEGRRVTVMK